jgi:hypothetical protein
MSLKTRDESIALAHTPPGLFVVISAEEPFLPAGHAAPAAYSP